MVRHYVRLDAEAYAALLAAKSPTESFSDLVKRLAKKRSILEFAGAWKGLPQSEADFLESGFRRAREAGRRRAARLARQWKRG